VKKWSGTHTFWVVVLAVIGIVFLVELTTDIYISRAVGSLVTIAIIIKFIGWLCRKRNKGVTDGAQ